MLASTLPIPAPALNAESPWVKLEQPPVADTALNLKDLARMLALVRSGTSAHGYQQPNCPCSLIAGAVIVPLVFYVWPSLPGLAYELQVPFGELSGPEVVSMEREFSFVVPFDKSKDLPFRCESINWTWADLPCFDRFGNQVDRPEVSVGPTRVQLGGEVLAVLRIRCLAVGYRYRLELNLPKEAAARTRVNTPTVTALWQQSGATVSQALSLSIPGCAMDLLETCEDGRLRGEAIWGVTERRGQRVPFLYFNECTGAAFPVQYQAS